MSFAFINHLKVVVFKINYTKIKIRLERDKKEKEQILLIKGIRTILIFRQKWESLLKIVRCEIISFCRNDQVDAYVLR